jgi:hypothetical protein
VTMQYPYTMAVGGASFQMMQAGVQALTLSAALPIADTNGKYGTYARTGTFRLALGSSTTGCLDYHISAADLQGALNRELVVLSWVL